MEPPVQPPRKTSKFKLFLLALAALSAGLYWIDSAPSTSHSQFFPVPPGASASAIAADLEQSGQIRSRLWFLALARATNASTRLQAGLFQIHPGRPCRTILRDMVSGRSKRLKITVPEGFASWQIAERLEAQAVCKAAPFLEAVAREKAEGFLFPDTYYFQESMGEERVIEIMQDRFRDVWKEVIAQSSQTADTASDEAWKNQKARLPDDQVWTCLKITTLASLVEREAQRADERDMISAVYHNRLKKWMPLESDPTVQYSLGYWKDRILFKDLKVENPYNTYRHYGLPPGPICSVGKESLAAALNPAPVPYLYFVADGEGGHNFSTTFDEHRVKVQKRNRERRKRN